MGLWKTYFHWSVLLRWDVVAWMIATLLAVGGIMLFFGQYPGANLCFMSVAFWIFAKIAHIATVATDPPWHRFLFAFLLFGILGVAIVETVRGINKWAGSQRGKIETPATPAQPVDVSGNKPPMEDHGTTDKVEAEPEHHGTTDKTKTETEHPEPKGPRLGIGPEAYKDLSDAQVAQWAVEEADKIEELANNAMKPGFGSPNAARWFFRNKFNDCCAQDVQELRTEILRRLGPPAKDPDEISAWTMLFPQIKYPGAPAMIDPGVVAHYAPYLRRLGLQLKRRAVPRSTPLALQFSEQQIPPEKPGSSTIVVTIKTKRELLAGYIAVQFSAQPYSVGCDFQDSKLALTADIPPDNSMVAELLKATTNYVLQIGKTAFTPTKPIHVEARASTAIHVSAVTFLEE